MTRGPIVGIRALIISVLLLCSDRADGDGLPNLRSIALTLFHIFGWVAKN
jgi:hypothetical protein